MPLEITLNGRPRLFETLEEPVPLSAIVSALELKADRIAAELNGEIARRGTWSELLVCAGDKLEIVHFVGGGCSSRA